jgi:hypothetical protein
VLGHETHAAVESAAALVLSLGGAAVLVRAWLDGHRGRPSLGRAVAVSPGAAVRRSGRIIVVALSAGAAAIHLAAGPEHVDELGDVGLLFYLAALFQAAFAIALLAHHGTAMVVRIAILGNLALVVAWAWTRTVGPASVVGGPDVGPEAIGIADGITVLLELATVLILLAWVERLDTWIASLAAPATVRTLATSGLVTVAGVALLATGIAVADAGAGHHHDGAEPDHATTTTARLH